MDTVDGVRVGWRQPAGLLTEKPETSSNGGYACSTGVQGEIAMGMGGGGTGGAVSEINVTPLIDVLLVLLIIFMVIVPVTPKGLEALVPQPPKTKSTICRNERTIVVQVLSNGGAAPSYKINETVFARRTSSRSWSRSFATRQEKVMFVKGDPDLDFSKVAEVIDFGHSGRRGQYRPDHIAALGRPRRTPAR
jgi:biopolymer transport protein TolR